MTIYRLPKKFLVLMLCLAALPLLLGVTIFILSFRVSAESFGIKTVFIFLNGFLFVGGGFWALYCVLRKVSLRIEVGKDTVSFYPALRAAAISPAEIKNVKIVPEGGLPIGAIVAHAGGREYLLSKMSRFDELVHKLTPASKTGFVRPGV